MRSLVLTLDLDGPREYAALHNLAAGDSDPLVMYGAPLRRFRELCAACGATGTLFAVGRDLRAQAIPALRAAASDGYEIANHSHNHDYQLSRKPPQAIAEELAASQAAFAAALGLRPKGFRAPGYITSARLLDQLEGAGFAYSSSLMPSPPYYAAKTAVLLAYRLRGIRSASLLGSPGPWLGPRQPYRPGQLPWLRGSRKLWELPVAVATPLRLPVTAATLVLAPAPLRRRLLRSLAGVRHLVLNMHAMDLLDPCREALAPPLAAKQPELRIPVEQRMVLLSDILLELAATRTVTTCGGLVEML